MEEAVTKNEMEESEKVQSSLEDAMDALGKLNR